MTWQSFIPRLHILDEVFSKWRVQGFLESLQYIGPLRVYPERSYRSQPLPALDVGIDGYWAPHLLRRATEEQLRDLRHWLGLEGFGLVKDLRVRDMKDPPNFVVEVNVQGQWVNLRDVGFGMSQLLPIVVESTLVPAKRRQELLLLLEQPEIHLHPKAQSDLGTFIAEMTRKGRRYLIETHSEYLVMRLATEVRRGKLSPDDIAIYFLNLDEHGHTQFSNSQYGVKCVRSGGFSRILSVGQSPGRVLMTSRSEICHELHELMPILRSSFVKIRAIRGGKCRRPDEKYPITLDGVTIASKYTRLKPLLRQNENCCTQFRHIPLEEDGRLPPPGEWPEGFFDTDIGEADAFLFASPELVEA